jgi:hypothetical protein
MGVLNFIAQTTSQNLDCKLGTILQGSILFFLFFISFFLFLCYLFIYLFIEFVSLQVGVFIFITTGSVYHVSA